MNGYSTCCQVSLQKSRSTDFPEFYTPFHEAKPILNQNSRNPDRKSVQNTQINVRHEPKLGPEEGDNEAGEIFGVILSRISSVKSTNCHVEKKKSLLESAVGRVFSMRSNFSVGEGYCRIQHSDDGDEHPALLKRRSRRKRGHFLGRLFGF